MRHSIRALIGASILAAAAVVPLGSTAFAATSASASTSTESSASALAAGWHRRGPFTSYAACDRVRSQQTALGRPTQACYYLRCGTAPRCIDGWYYLLYT